MKLFRKIYWLIKPLLMVVFMLILEKLCKLDNIVLSSSISVLLAFLLSPKVVIVEKQNGEEEQIKWLFFKKVINKEM